MSREHRKQAMRDRVQEAFGASGEPLPSPDRTGRIIEAIVAFALGTGFWRLVVSDSWVASAVFGVLLAGVLLAYGLYRARLVTERRDGDRGRPRR